MIDPIELASEIKKCEESFPTPRTFTYATANADGGMSQDEYQSCVSIQKERYPGITQEMLDKPNNVNGGCGSTFIRTRREYCDYVSRKKLEGPTPTPTPTGTETLPVERDPELIKKKAEADVLEKEAELKKKAAAAEEQAVTAGKEKLSAGKTAVLKAAISLIPKPPVDPRILQAAQLIAQARQASRKKAADAKDTVSKAKEQYSFPLAPITPQPASGLTPTVTPTVPVQPPALPIIETNFPPDPEPIKIKYGVRIKSSRRSSTTFEIAQIQIGNDNMVNAPFGVCPITVNTGDEVQAIERITQIIRTNSFCSGNDPQPDFTYPGANNINWNALIY